MPHFPILNKQLSVNCLHWFHCMPGMLPLFHLQIFQVGSLNNLGGHKSALTKVVKFPFLGHEVSSEAFETYGEFPED